MEANIETGPIKIFTLGRFNILRNDCPIQPVGKVQRKPLELLKAIISYGSREIPDSLLADALWPDAQGDMAYQSFNTTLHRLRRLVGNDMAIKFHGGQLTLDDRYFWVDAWVFERIVENIEDVFKRTGETGKEKNGDILDPSPPNASIRPFPIPQAEAVRLSEKIFSIYKGLFLPSDTRHLWTVSTRERLRNKFHRLIIMLGDYMEQSGHLQMAVEHYQSAIEVDAIVEEFYQHLIICHRWLDQRDKAIEVYQRLRNIFSSHFGIKPSATTEAIYKTMISENT